MLNSGGLPPVRRINGAIFIDKVSWAVFDARPARSRHGGCAAHAGRRRKPAPMFVLSMARAPHRRFGRPRRRDEGALSVPCRRPGLQNAERAPCRRAMMRPTLVLLVVGLTPHHVGSHTPHLARFARAGGLVPLGTITPAVTCSVQATFTTGALPRQHGIVANGWLFRDLMEIWLWRQSNRLV